jgi:protein-L-isoaspartate(D-aspartate) O-methyltransferase
MTGSHPLTPGVWLPDMRQTDPLDQAVATIPRYRFVPAERRMTAGLDVDLLITEGRSCPRPSLIRALLANQLPGPGHRVFVAWAGNGYLLALLDALGVRDVDAWEPSATLRQCAESGLASLGCSLQVHWRSEEEPDGGAPGYDRMLSVACLNRFPRPWLYRLAPGGSLTVPVLRGRRAVLWRAERGTEGVRRVDLGTYRWPLAPSRP